jgi:hypothetical protein
MDTSTYGHRGERSGEEGGNWMEEQRPGKSKAFSPTQTTPFTEVYANYMDQSKHGQGMGRRLGERN